MAIETSLEIPTWVPPAVVDEAKRLHTSFTPAAKHTEILVLSNLVSDIRMRKVWQELYKKKRVEHAPTNEYKYPARMTNASRAAHLRSQANKFRAYGEDQNEEEANAFELEANYLERLRERPADSKWTEQDRGVQAFFRKAFINPNLVNPVYKSDIDLKIRTLADSASVLRQQASILLSLGMTSEAKRLNKVAAQLDDESIRESVVDYDANDPWVIGRDRGDAIIRTYVIDLSISAIQIFGQQLTGTLATIANVVFGQDNITSQKTREWLR